MMNIPAGSTGLRSTIAWEEGIALGVRRGLFGLGEIDDGRPIGRYFKEQSSVGFIENEVLIRERICRREVERPPPTLTEPVSDLGVEISGPILEEGKERIREVMERVQLRFPAPKGKVSSLWEC